MAEQCVSVKFEGDNDFWNYCWEDTTPYPGWTNEAVTTGLRPGQAGGARAWRSCQYFLKGMPSTCIWWKEGEAGGTASGTTTSGDAAVNYHCAFKEDNESENPLDPPPGEPRGYNFGQCDFLGRRSWCDQYKESEDYDKDKWICTAPNPYLTGMGEKTIIDQTAYFKHRTRDRIWGYNDDGTGTGQCDCAGFGRGAEGCKVVGTGFTGSTTQEMEDALGKLPIVCNYYRPYSLGFGIIEPSMAQKGDVEADGITVTEEGWKRAAAWEADPGYRLPLSYKLYNERAKYQKCQWWEEESGREYEVDSTGTSIYLDGDPDIFNSTGRVEFCKCTSAAATPYNTRILESTASGTEDTVGGQMALEGVWATGGGPVCNGCRPECPCYSGKWTYLTHERMYPGMAVTANQILELRFWEQEWESQKAYDDYYNQKPNFVDPPSPAIYTFTKWVGKDEDSSANAVAGIDITKSKMVGQKLTLCQPAPLHRREFDKVYITGDDEVSYYAGNIGTSDESGQRKFPNLIRDPSFGDYNPLTVVYPPTKNDPFNDEYCVLGEEEDGYIKRSSNMSGDHIKAIGHTFINKTIYVINTSKIKATELLETFGGIYTIRDKNVIERAPESIKNEAYNDLRKMVNKGLAEHPDYITFTTSDDKFGYFLSEPVKLDYNKVNKLLICVDYGDGTWEYRWRDVSSGWYGGVVKQTLYEHKYGNSENGYTNPTPQFIGGPDDETPSYGKAVASLIPLGGAANASEAPEVVSTFSLDDIYRGKTYYDYAYEVFTHEDYEEDHWGAVGNTNKIIAAIDDLNINYIYDWTIDSAALIYKGEDEDKAALYPSPIELEILLIDDNYIGPNYCLLQPKEDIRVRFFNSEWTLQMKYRYIKPTNSPQGGTSIWGAGRTGTSILADTPHTIDASFGSVEVTDIDRGSVQLLTHFRDEDGRNISAFGTKLLLQIVNESCRNVDIFYRYSALGKKWQLNPLAGMCINIKNDTVTGEFVKHVETPNCGDHEYSVQKWEGPMWYPFNACRGYDMYDEFTICNNCQAGYVGPDNEGVAKDESGNKVYVGGGTVLKRNDYRYCGPYKYDAYGAVRGNWISTCDCGCSFWFSDASSVTPIFTGYGRIKSTVDLIYYAENDWTPPPFGNEGRELMEKYISHDYVTHLIPFSVGGLLQRADWMPLMLDHSSFYASFNSYDDNPEEEYMGIAALNGFEPFRYVHQMTMAMLPVIGEELQYEEDEEGKSTGELKRYEWSELFELIHEGNCSYPLPTYPEGTSATKAVYYTLKPEWAAWAWQENWDDIERDTGDEPPETAPAEGDEEDPRTITMEKLDFVNIKKPRYIIDYYKTEHRRITEEDHHQIIYTAPVVGEKGELEKWPTLSLDGQHPRPFELFYPEDSYTRENDVEWRDEGGQADTQGSADEDNIYEEASGSDWVNEDNMLFDKDASSSTAGADAAGRKVVIGKEDFLIFFSDYIYKYYNRGVIAEMTRDRLYHLPKEEFEIEDQWDEEGSTPEYEEEQALVPGIHVWKGPADLVYTFSTASGTGEEGEGEEGGSGEEDESIALSNIVVTGNWGYSEGMSDSYLPRPTIHTMARPSCSVSCKFSDGTTGTPKGVSATISEGGTPPKGSEPEEYEIYLDFLLGPIEMLKKKIAELTITLSVGSEEFISLSSVVLTTAKYIDIVYEDIYVWERKYVASKFQDKTGHGINLDGPGEHLHYQNDLLNMGQYYNFRDPDNESKVLSAWDKTKVISHDVRYDEDEDITALEYNTLKFIEFSTQRDLYEKSFKNDPMAGNKLTYTGFAPYRMEAFLSEFGENFPTESLEVDSERLVFDKHKLFKEFKQYPFWRPGGHYYTWNTDEITEQKCRLFNAAEPVYTAKYVHKDHRGIGTPIAGAETPVDPGNSYYSLRFYTQQAKYDRAMILGGGTPEYTNRWSGAGPTGTFVGGS